MGREDEIRVIAYSIWEEEGCRDGLDWEHWFRAQAIWEGQDQKAVAKSTKTESKRPIKQNAKVKAANKKPPRS